MGIYLQLIITGITTGAVYGLAGVGLVLTYRTSGVFNFAHGAIATAGAYLFYELSTQHGISPWLALPVTVVVTAVILGVAFERVARQLADTPPLVAVVATVALLLIIEGGASVIFGVSSISAPDFLPSGTFPLAGVRVGYDQLIIVLIGVLVSVALALTLTRSRFGVAMRGVVDSASLMAISGIDATAVRRLAWIIGGAVAALSGVVLAPSTSLDPIRLTYLVVQAFGAAAIGRFSKLPLTFVGGLGIGVVASLSQKFAANYPVLLGLPASIPFIVLFIVLLSARVGSLPTFGAIRRRPPERFAAMTTPIRISLGVIAAAVVLSIPSLVGAKLPLYIDGAGFVIMFMSLGLLVNIGGQVSLCQGAFVAVGAVAFSWLTQDLGLPWLIALPIAGLMSAPIGAAIALPAIRLSGVYLALATFAFSLMMENLVYRTSLMFGSQGHRIVLRPVIPGGGPASEREYFYLAVVLAAIVGLLLLALQRSRLGRLLRALADSPVALTTFGGGVNTALVLLFSISALFAGVAGAVISAGTGAAGPASFGSLNSLLWLAIIAIAGRRLVSSAVLAAILLAVVPGYLPDSLIQYQQLAFGVGALIAALLAAHPLGLVSRVKASVANAESGGKRHARLTERRDDPTWHRPTRSARLLVDVAGGA